MPASLTFRLQAGLPPERWIRPAKSNFVLRYKDDPQGIPMFVPLHCYTGRASESAAFADRSSAQCSSTGRRLILSQTNRLTKQPGGARLSLRQ